MTITGLLRTSALVALLLPAWLLPACGGSSSEPIEVVVATIREALGATPASINGSIGAFRADLGEPNNGAGSAVSSGRREINWDGVPDANAAPALFPGDFFNATSPRGAIFLANGTSVVLQVSADAANPSSAGVRFANLNSTYASAFSTFTAERLFAPLGTNELDIVFRVAGTNDPALVRGFGAVLCDVDDSGTTAIEFYDRRGDLAFRREVLAAGDSDGFLSFLGVTFETTAIARVRIILGSGAMLQVGSPNDVSQGGAVDVVAVDDILYSEPQPQ